MSFPAPGSAPGLGSKWSSILICKTITYHSIILLQLTVIKHKVGLCIYMDDSNIWIGAKKGLTGKLMVPEDPRVRIEVGRLLDVVSQKRPIVKCHIYGSVPPSMDSFWTNYADAAAAKVITFARSPVTGREKQVDTELVLDVYTGAQEYSNSPCKFIVVMNSGDLDVLPAIRKVLENTECLLELWSWKASLSKDLLKFQAEHSRRLNIDYFDEKGITYKELVYKYKQLRAVRYRYLLTLTKPTTLQEVNTCVEELTRWPAQYILHDAQKVEVIFRSVGNYRFEPRTFERDIMRNNHGIDIISVRRYSTPEPEPEHTAFTAFTMPEPTECWD